MPVEKTVTPSMRTSTSARMTIVRSAASTSRRSGARSCRMPSWSANTRSVARSAPTGGNAPCTTITRSSTGSAVMSMRGAKARVTYSSAENKSVRSTSTSSCVVRARSGPSDSFDRARTMCATLKPNEPNTKKKRKTSGTLARGTWANHVASTTMKIVATIGQRMARRSDSFGRGSTIGRNRSSTRRSAAAGTKAPAPLWR